MTAYERNAADELQRWKAQMLRPGSWGSGMAGRIQRRIANAIPEKAHQVITAAIRQMISAVQSGAGFTTQRMAKENDLEKLEERVLQRIDFYQTAAAAEGALTGAGGILLGMADFPLWLSLKMKMLFEIAALYDHDVQSPEERVFILRIFELTFSSPSRRAQVFDLLAHWKTEDGAAGQGFESFDWRRFQQEYRDSLDVVKLLQLVPGIGAPVGAVVNHRLTRKLGITAMNAYRTRWEGLSSLSREPD